MNDMMQKMRQKVRKGQTESPDFFHDKMADVGNVASILQIFRLLGNEYPSSLIIIHDNLTFRYITML